MQGIRMLLVDDEDDFRITLAERLKLRKIDVTVLKEKEKIKGEMQTKA
jgi:ActR/RegA family two-component response regulator